MDDYSLGKRQAAVDLVSILNDMHPFYRRKVVRYINDYRKGLEQLRLMTDDKLKYEFALMWRRRFLEHSIDELVNSFYRNIIIGEFREFCLTEGVVRLGGSKNKRKRKKQTKKH